MWLGKIAFLAAVAAAGTGFPKAAWGQAPQSGANAGIERTLTTADNWQIYITYYQAPGKDESVTKNAAVVVLLHGDKENRLVWEGEKGLAPLLHQEGFAVITVDLRKHGQSTNVARSSGDSPAGGKNTEGTNMQAADYGNMVDGISPQSRNSFTTSTS